MSFGQVKEKKKQLKKEGKSLDMEEDDPEVVSENENTFLRSKPPKGNHVLEGIPDNPV